MCNTWCSTMGDRLAMLMHIALCMWLQNLDPQSQHKHLLYLMVLPSFIKAWRDPGEDTQSAVSHQWTCVTSVQNIKNAIYQKYVYSWHLTYKFVLCDQL
jgi:hypothetical protein